MNHSTFSILVYVLLSTTMIAQTKYPNLPNVSVPSPEPALPSSFDPFLPPVTTDPVAANAPAIAEWTRMARPDSVLALTGSRFSNFTDTSAGKDTQFQVFAQNSTSSYMGTASILRLDGLKAAIILPASLPADGEVLVWPVNSAGAGYPVAVNATEAWWLGPNAATRGDTVSVYGRNLSHAGSPVTSSIYIQRSGAAGVWATVTAANPYKVDFTVPASLTNGTYQVWIHNGQGGHYGWSGPLALTINNGMPWTTQMFNVKNYGAKGDGVTDDEAAIQAAMLAAAKAPWSSVYLPAGNYMVSSGFNMPCEVRWLGDGATKTFIKANAGFVKPAKDNPRRYCLFYSNGLVSDVAYQDLTIDSNGNLNQVLQEAVGMRFSTDVRFTNVTIKAKGYSIADLHGSTRVSFQNCDLIGGESGVFFGSATQVSVNGCRIYGTNDANTLLTCWGADSFSCTNTTAQDYDDSASDGWAQGRFVYGSSQWGSNRNFYIGNNTTIGLAVRPGCSSQNTGEQLLWENGTDYSGKPTSATATTVTFGSNAFFSNSAVKTGIYDAVIVNGTGLGQHRKIIGCAGTTITVSPAWTVAPDTTSTVIAAGVVSHCAIYQNSLQGKSTYTTQITASAGIQPYGNSFDFIADGNSISQVCNGIYMWGMAEAAVTPQSVDCVYFNYIANNTVTHCINGIVGVSQAWNGWPVADPYPGISYLGNTCTGNQVDTMVTNGVAEMAACPPTGDQMDLSIYDQNTVTGAPTAVNLAQATQINNAVLYKNGLSLGTAAVSGSVGLVMGSTPPALRQNTYTGFQSTYGGPMLPTPASEAPSHVVSVVGTAGGVSVQSSLVLWDVGPSTLSWNIASGANWLTVSQGSGSIADEAGASTLTLTCAPHALASGTYTASIVVQAAGHTRTYSVNITVQ